jgi:pimeloyl-[acyl-carrier protein] synthase
VKAMRKQAGRSPGVMIAGIHYCLGAALAQLEAQIAMNTLLERAPKLRLRGVPEALRRSLILRGLESLPVEF